MTGILTNFTGRDALLWGHQPLKLTYGLGDHALFSRSALIRLIETYPRAHYSLIAKDDSRLWQEGDLAGASGETLWPLLLRAAYGSTCAMCQAWTRHTAACWTQFSTNCTRLFPVSRPTNGKAES